MGKYRTEIKWALIFVLMVLIWMTMERLAGLHSFHIGQHPIYTNFIAIPAIAVYVLALLDKRKKVYRGQMNYLQGFVTGLGITLLVTLLSPLTQVLVSKVITPEYFQNAMHYAVSTGKMQQAAAEAYFNLNNYIMQGLIGTPVMGVLTSAAVAFFTRSRHTNTTKGQAGIA